MPSSLASETTPSRRRTPAAVWVGVLVPPAAWAIQLIGDWAMGEVIACAPASRPAGVIYGVHVDVAAAIVNAILLLATIVAGVVSAGRWRSGLAGAGDASSDATTWLAMAGVISSALFSLLIATSFVPILLIGGCP